MSTHSRLKGFLSAFFLLLLALSPLSSEDILDLMNQLQRGESEFVSNSSEYSEWNYGQISGLEGAALPVSQNTSSSPSDRQLDFGSDESNVQLDFDDSNDKKTEMHSDESAKKVQVAEDSTSKFLITSDQKGGDLSPKLTIRSSFTLRELVTALNDSGFEVSLSKRSRELLGFRYQLFFDSAPFELVLKWISATTGQKASFQNRKVYL